MMAAAHIGDEAGCGHGARAGTAAVEFTLLVPVLLLLLLGTIDLGRLLIDHQRAVQGLRAATRYLARADPADLGVNCALGSVDPASAPAFAAMRMAMTGTLDGSGAYGLAYWTDSSSLSAAGLAISVTCVDNAGGAYGGLYDNAPKVAAVTMRATIGFPLLNGWLLGRGASLPLRVRHQQVHIGGWSS